MPKQKSAQKLFEYPNPLDQMMGKDFFSEIPSKPGIYFFENDGQVVFVGNAKNLSTRLGAYKRARPLDVPVRTRRLLFTADKIRWEQCPSAADALAKEHAVIRNIRPLYNTTDARPEKYPFLFLKYKAYNKRLHLKLMADASGIEQDEESQVFGAFPGRGCLRQAYGAILRILWFAAEAEKKNGDFDDAPAQLFRARPPLEFQVRCELKNYSQLQAYMGGIRGLPFVEELRAKLLAAVKPGSFHAKVLSNDFKKLGDFYEKTLSYDRRLRKFHKIGRKAQSLKLS